MQEKKNCLWWSSLHTQDYTNKFHNKHTHVFFSSSWNEVWSEICLHGGLKSESAETNPVQALHSVRVMKRGYNARRGVAVQN